MVQYTGVLRIKYVEFVWKYTGQWYVFDTYQLHVKAMIYYCNIIIWMEMEKSKVLIQFLVIFRQSGDVLFFLYARRLRGYTATQTLITHGVNFFRFKFIWSLWFDCFLSHWRFHDAFSRYLKFQKHENWWILEIMLFVAQYGEN